MTTEELRKKVEQLRAVTNAKLQHLREHSKMLDLAFAELDKVQESDLAVIHHKIDELGKRFKKIDG